MTLYLRHRLSLVIFQMLLTAGLIAQTDRGFISGTITDSSGAVLPGARIDVGPKAPSVVSDAQGHFLVSNLPSGSYTVSVSYIGFAPFSTTANVTAGAVARVDAALQVE